MDSSSQSDKKPSMGTLLSDVVDRMLRVQPVVADKRSENLTQKRANIRAASVREGFQSMRARSDEMAQRLQHYRRQHDASFGKADVQPETDTPGIVLRSTN
jgi:hypothetical protein